MLYFLEAVLKKKKIKSRGVSLLLLFNCLQFVTRSITDHGFPAFLRLVFNSEQQCCLCFMLVQN